MRKMAFFLALCLLLPGCKRDISQETTASETATVQTTAVQTEIPETTEQHFVYFHEEDVSYVQLYAPVLDTYYQALTEKWNQAQCAQANISILTAYCTEGAEPLQNMCFLFHDLDGDGDKELLIGAAVNDEPVDRQLFEVCDLVDGEPRQLLCGSERNRYYLCYDENSVCWIANEGSGGAAVSGWFYSLYDGMGLAVQKSVIFDADTSPSAPWYLGQDGEWDVTGKEPVDEAAARSVIASFDAIKGNIHRDFSHQHTFDDLT